MKGIYLPCHKVMKCLNSSQRIDHDGLMSWTADGELLGGGAGGVDRWVKPKTS